MSCYWAGFILADGYIRIKKRFTLEIKLQKKDIQHLHKFKTNINFEGSIKLGKNYCSITISSSQIINDLMDNFEIGTKKSLTCYISKLIPFQYLTDFIRGYFDGDGSITFTSIDAINFIGTKKTILFIRDFFYNFGVKLRTKDKPNITKNKNIFSISYSGISAFKCLRIMYENASISLVRKEILYTNLKSKYEKWL